MPLAVGRCGRRLLRGNPNPSPHPHPNPNPSPNHNPNPNPDPNPNPNPNPNPDPNQAPFRLSFGHLARVVSLRRGLAILETRAGSRPRFVGPGQRLATLCCTSLVVVH
eukprot:scaffold115541_cov42-Phaeocystis_antarctica.AAC.1